MWSEEAITTVFMTIGVLALQGDFDSHRAMLESVAGQNGDTLRIVAVRDAKGLEECDALVIPGGESTVMSRLCDRYELWEPLRARLDQGMGALGTCAGMILLARNIQGATRNFQQKTLGALDIDVARNAYGAQADSFETDIALDDSSLETNAAQADVAALEENALNPDGSHNQGNALVAPDEYSCGTRENDSRLNENAIAVDNSHHAVQSSDSEMLRAVFIRAPRITRCGAGVEVLARYEGSPVVVRRGRVMAAAFHPEIAGDARLHALWLRSLRTP